MRILVCGGRDFKDRFKLRATLYDLVHEFGMFTLIDGKAKGADQLASLWAIEVGCPLIEFPALWEKYGNAAGAIRNAQMLKEGRPDLVIAFPGGKGTANMVQCAIEARVPVRVIEDN